MELQPVEHTLSSVSMICKKEQREKTWISIGCFYNAGNICFPTHLVQYEYTSAVDTEHRPYSDMVQPKIFSTCR